MVFDAIEKLRREYTDRCVVVDDQRPELRRFRGMTGIVKTVNMSGRALVQFDGNNNIGWYDIEPDFLRIVEAPAPKKAEAKAAKPAVPRTQVASAATAKAAAAKPTVAKPAAGKKPAGAAGMSVADILAAVRGGASAKVSETPAKPVETKPGGKPEAKKMSTAEILAAARSKKAGGSAGVPVQAAPSPSAVKSPTKPAPGTMSTAEILAAARAGRAGGASAVATPAPVESPPVAKAEPAKEPDPKKLSTAEILAMCRKSDGAKGN